MSGEIHAPGNTLRCEAVDLVESCPGKAFDVHRRKVSVERESPENETIPVSLLTPIRCLMRLNASMPVCGHSLMACRGGTKTCGLSGDVRPHRPSELIGTFL